MKKILFSLTLATILFACQEKKEDKTTSAKTDSIASKTETEVSKEAPKETAKTDADYAKLILGRWVMPEDNGFEPWAFYDAEKTYSDGNEQGTEYEIKGDKMIYRVLGGGEPAEYKIVILNEKTLTIQLDKNKQETWTKADNKTTEKPKKDKTVAKIDAKLLIGKWYNDKEKDEFFMQRIYKANGKMDLTPYNDIYGYKVVGNLIKYSKIREGGDGVSSDDVITSLSKDKLVLNGKLTFKRIK
jgi:hypothetical protein